jgi:molybdopterin molybdotransferase
MAGFVHALSSRKEALEKVAASLGFPWQIESEFLPLQNALGRLLAKDIRAQEAVPAFSRSLRDGYAVRSADIIGASSSSPVFLDVLFEVPMGVFPLQEGLPGTAAGIYTGGVLPKGYDAVVMLEDTDRNASFLEVRRSLQEGENVLFQSEEYASGDIVLKAGTRIDYKTVGFLSALGIVSVPCKVLQIGILSTGDEIVPPETTPLPPGCVRDANSWMLQALLQEAGFSVSYFGIVRDDASSLRDAVEKALTQCHVLLLSGGSSVSSRDLCSDIFASFPAPGLIVRGLNMNPGKPTLIAGDIKRKRLLVGLPGHPHSCTVVALVVLLPLLNALAGVPKREQRTLFLSLGDDVVGKTGVEEFFPVFVKDGLVYPIVSKAGFVGSFSRAEGLLRLPENRETVRRGEVVEIWLL